MTYRMYTQVTVRRGGIEDVWWIASGFAVVGKRIRDEHRNVWKVLEVHGERDQHFLDMQDGARKQFAYVLGESDVNPRDADRGWCEVFCD